MLRRLAITVFVLLFAGILATGWYTYNKGFTQKWRTFVITEFRKRGVEVSMRRMTLDPFRGILAKEVKVYETRERKRTLAVVDEVRLVINYANLLQGETFIEALDLTDANLDIPLNPKKPGGTKVAIRQLSGRLIMPPQQLHLSHFEADFYGIRVTASGRLINPQAIVGRDNRARGGLVGPWMEKVINEVQALKFAGAAPQLEIRFSGDLKEPEKLFVDGALWAENIRRGNYECRSLYLRAGFRDGVLAVKQLTARDSRGALRATGQFTPADGQITAQFHSGLDLQALVSGFKRIPELEEAVFYAPPEIDATLRATYGAADSLRLLGQLTQRKFAYRSLIFDGFSADAVWEKDRWALRDLKLAHRNGEITGDVLRAPNMERTHLRSTIQRHLLDPVSTERTRPWLQQVEFAEPS